MAIGERQKRLPTIYLPHGGGPCFFMEWTMGPRDTWHRTAEWLRRFGDRFKDVRAVLVVSAHWEESVVRVQTGATPGLLYDYFGFPAHTYELTWPAPGAPDIAVQAMELLAASGIPRKADSSRGFDHGVFVPLKVAFPDATVPTFQISLQTGLRAATHIDIGRALAPLRDQGVLVVGSGLSFHNFRAFGGGSRAYEASVQFNEWLELTCRDAATREVVLRNWPAAPHARFCHPTEEHLMPLLVAAGAASGEQGRRVFTDDVMGVQVSAFEFGVVTDDTVLV